VKRLGAAILGTFLLAAVACLPAGMAHAADDPLTFVLIQPGSPGSSEEAAPLMARWADYLSAHLPGHPRVSGLYVNSLEQAKSVRSKNEPHFAIVTLPYYLVQFGALSPQLITRPGGRTEERYRLLVAATNPVAGWQTLKGEVAGTLCHIPVTVGPLLFQKSWGMNLPFHCQPTDRLLRAARQVVRGELSGVLVTDEQFTSLMALPEGKELRVLHESGPLPPPLVVTLGQPDALLHAVIQILLGMKDDPTAKALLTELRTDGFGPVDLEALQKLSSHFRLGEP
jgi:hypothetical protein